MKRMKIFHSKAEAGALNFFEQRVNEWIEENKIQVKFATQSYGEMPGRTGGREPTLFITLWY